MAEKSVQEQISLVREQISLVRGELLGLTGCLISVFGALHVIKRALPPNPEIIKDLEAEISELSERLDETIKAFKKFHG
jgi:hypothetical protein